MLMTLLFYYTRVSETYILLGWGPALLYTTLGDIRANIAHYALLDPSCHHSNPPLLGGTEALSL